MVAGLGVHLAVGLEVQMVAELVVESLGYDMHP
jgi:hypothetical protein